MTPNRDSICHAVSSRHSAAAAEASRLAVALCEGWSAKTEALVQKVFGEQMKIDNFFAEALHWLENSYEDHAGADIAWIRVDPLLDPLRGDPRFDPSRRSSRLAIASCEGWLAKAEALAEKIVPGREFKAATASK